MDSPIRFPTPKDHSLVTSAFCTFVRRVTRRFDMPASALPHACGGLEGANPAGLAMPHRC